jgi:hypothetical protein
MSAKVIPFPQLAPRSKTGRLQHNINEVVSGVLLNGGVEIPADALRGFATWASPERFENESEVRGLYLDFDSIPPFDWTIAREWMSGAVSPERREALDARAEPTPSERRLYRILWVRRALLIEEEGCVWQYYLLRVRHEDMRSCHALLLARINEAGKVEERFEGFFPTIEDAEKHLHTTGSLFRC